MHHFFKQHSVLFLKIVQFGAVIISQVGLTTREKVLLRAAGRMLEKHLQTFMHVILCLESAQVNFPHPNPFLLFHSETHFESSCLPVDA